MRAVVMDIETEVLRLSDISEAEVVEVELKEGLRWQTFCAFLSRQQQQ